MIFRPQLWPTVVMVPALALLIGLGQWQLHRLEWKRALIAAAESRSQAAPMLLDEALALPADEIEYRRVTVAGRFDHAREAYLYANPGGGLGPGYMVLTPLIRDGAPPVLVNRGFVPEDRRQGALRPPGPAPGLVTVTGLLRMAEEPGLFTPPPDQVRRIWYRRDVAAIAATLGIEDTPPVLLDADASSGSGGWPKGGVTRIHFANRHQEYALTWFALAAVLVVIYFAYHRTRGRLTWR